MRLSKWIAGASLLLLIATAQTNAVRSQEQIRPGRNTEMNKASAQINTSYQNYRRGFVIGFRGEKVRVSKELQFDVAVTLRPFASQAALKRSLKRAPLPLAHVFEVTGTLAKPIIQGAVDTARVPELHRKGRVKSIDFVFENQAKD